MAVIAPLEELPPNQNSYVWVTLSQLWENLPRVVLGAGLFSLSWAPAALLFYLGLFAPAVVIGALTIAPAWVALLGLEAEIVREKRAGIGVMLRGLPRYGRRAVGLGLLAAFPLLAGLATLPSLARPEVPAVVWVGLAADGLGLLILLTLSVYAVPLVVLNDLPLGMALRNALLLAGRHIVNTVGLLSMVVIFGFGVLYISSALAFLLPAVWGLFVVNNCRMVVAAELAALDLHQSPPTR